MPIRRATQIDFIAAEVNMVTVVRDATLAEQSVVQNIDQFYLYEFSRYMPDFYQLGADGLFHDEDYARYWSDADKYPYLIVHDRELAGFALVEDQGDMRVLAQFFVLFKFQGEGIARTAALDVFGKHPGCWVVHSLLANPKSEGFWPKVIAEVSAGDFSISLQEPKRTHHIYQFAT